MSATPPIFCTDETAAIEFIEAMRWDGAPICVHCASPVAYAMRDAKTGGRSERFLWRCHDCKKQFTYRSGTVMADSLIPARFWCLALWLACNSPKGVSSFQIKRETGLSYKSALFLMHRIRKATTS